MRMPLIAAAATAVLLVGCNTTPSRPPRVVVGDRPLKVDAFGSLNPDCTSLGETVVQVTRAPQNGRAEIRRGTDFPRFSQANIRVHCNTQRAQSTLVFYTATKGFRGSDSFDVEVIFPSGDTRKATYDLEVR